LIGACPTSNRSLYVTVCEGVRKIKTSGLFGFFASEAQPSRRTHHRPFGLASPPTRRLNQPTDISTPQMTAPMTTAVQNLAMTHDESDSPAEWPLPRSDCMFETDIYSPAFPALRIW
jgi:hypothetical protein